MLDALLRLLERKQIYFHFTQLISYMIDGGILHER